MRPRNALCVPAAHTHKGHEYSRFGRGRKARVRVAGAPNRPPFIHGGHDLRNSRNVLRAEDQAGDAPSSVLHLCECA